MDFWLSAAAVVSLLAWAWLTALHGRRFWRCSERLPETAPAGTGILLPGVVAVVPARDEAGVIAASVESLLRQDWPEPFPIVVVDDHSTDGTADLARAAAAGIPGGAARLHVLPAPPLPAGWTGKLAAQRAGLDHARALAPEAALVWLTDADIAHGPTVLRRLHARMGQDRVMASVMARLDVSSGWARLLIPAFIYFFMKLYPFLRVNDAADPMAAAAGGCVLVRRAALEAAGLPDAIRGEIIDDCALGRALKRQGPVWLGLSRDVVSLRPSAGLHDVWHMVTRTAFEQLHHSVLLLAGTILGMTLIYLTPPVAAVAGLVMAEPVAAAAGLAAWLLMAVTQAPTLKLYGLPGWRGLLLPVSGVLYTLMTLDSARRHWQGRGGSWKGRVQGGRVQAE